MRSRATRCCTAGPEFPAPAPAPALALALALAPVLVLAARLADACRGFT
ncbi:hypothetical protein ACWENA_04925 [Streptomyces sp. NPDC004779]